jgi:hypothetical protein
LGKDAYIKLGTRAREEHVYNEVMANKHLFSAEELSHAQRYIETVRIKQSKGIID